MRWHPSALLGLLMVLCYLSVAGGVFILSNHILDRLTAMQQEVRP